MSEFIPLISVADVPTNKTHALTVEGVDLLICNSNDDIVVVENRCSHQDQPLTNGRVRNGYIICPLHGMRYRLTDGEAVGQLTKLPIRVFNTRIECGVIEIEAATLA